jgi:reactive intermediate/imine deaminase
MKRVVDSSENADVLGPYSHGTTNGDVLFTAGQISITPDGEVLGGQPISVQTEQALANIKRILASEGLTMDHILKTTVYMTDIDDFDEMNEIYRSFFDSAPPARTAFEVQRLADGSDIEIEAVAAYE